ncbi:unnamed protein product [Spirodela intermedia]|uniref:Uncharacterized protein n=1 Tax=Spirodela intermedia TaxID=51605 RepID=A0A7I8JC33_SPIIN|nr:unnamed protein product [Spirodela intermedia]CAA6667295.1 unnamed protein product [Spirodela intermedia]
MHREVGSQLVEVVIEGLVGGDVEVPPWLDDLAPCSWPSPLDDVDCVVVPVHLPGDLRNDVHQPLGFPDRLPWSVHEIGGPPLADPVPVVLWLWPWELPPENGALIFLQLHWRHFVGRHLPHRDALAALLLPAARRLIPLLPVPQELPFLHDRRRLLEVLEIEVQSEILPFVFLVRIGGGGQADAQIHHERPNWGGAAGDLAPPVLAAGLAAGSVLPNVGDLECAVLAGGEDEPAVGGGGVASAEGAAAAWSSAVVRSEVSVWNVELERVWEKERLTRALVESNQGSAGW